MSTVDPAVERARRQERQKGGTGSLLGLLIAAAGCLVCGYLFGRGIAGIVAVFLWMDSQGVNEMSASEGPPYLWGLIVGIVVGIWMPMWYWSASQRFTGGTGLPINGLSLVAVATACGVWLQGVRWTGPEYYWSNHVQRRATEQEEYWLVEPTDRWLPVAFTVVAALILAFSIWSFVQRSTKSTRAQNLLDTGRQAPGVVTAAAWTGTMTNGHKLIQFTVRFTDHAGVQRWVTKKATFGPAAIPAVGMPATVLYDPAHLDEDEILVTLEPLEVVENLRDAGPTVPQRTSTGQDADPSPPWGSPSDGFYHGDTGHGYYRGDGVGH